MKRTSLLLMGLLLQILLVKAQPYFPFPNKGITYFGGYLNSNIHYALAPLDSIVGRQPKQYTFPPATLPVYDNESSKEYKKKLYKRNKRLRLVESSPEGRETSSPDRT